MTAAQPYHHGSLRQTLIDLASLHIADDGVDSLSVRALARTAGVAHRAAYQHFPDKDALVAAVLTAGYLRLAARFDKAVQPRAGWARRLEVVALTYSDFAFDEPRIFIAMTGRWPRRSLRLLRSTPGAKPQTAYASDETVERRRGRDQRGMGQAIAVAHLKTIDGEQRAPT